MCTAPAKQLPPPLSPYWQPNALVDCDSDSDWVERGICSERAVGGGSCSWRVAVDIDVAGVVVDEEPGPAGGCRGRGGMSAIWRSELLLHDVFDDSVCEWEMEMACASGAGAAAGAAAAATASADARAGSAEDTVGSAERAAAAAAEQEPDHIVDNCGQYEGWRAKPGLVTEGVVGQLQDHQSD